MLIQIISQVGAKRRYLVIGDRHRRVLSFSGRSIARRPAQHLAVLRDFCPFLAGVLAPRLIFLTGSAVRIDRLAVVAAPAGLYGGEITGKGYVNQQQVLIARSTLVELFSA